MSGKPIPFNRSDFKTFRTLDTRWMDIDIYGHVNNVQYLSYFDTAINGWYVERGMLDLEQSSEVFLVVETGCKFFSEIKFPQVVDAGIRVKKLGRSSVRYEIALFVGGSDTSCAQGEYVHVLVDRQSRRPVEISGNKREELEALLVG